MVSTNISSVISSRQVLSESDGDGPKAEIGDVGISMQLLL